MAVEGLSVGVYRPRDLGSYDWSLVRSMEQEAYRNGGFSESEVGALLFLGECRGLERYIQSKSRPRKAVVAEPFGVASRSAIHASLLLL